MNHNFFANLRQDLRVAARSLRHAPLFAVIVVATLAVGIGVNTTMFSVVDTILMRPLPYPDSERLYHVGVRSIYGNSTYGLRGNEYWGITDGADAIETLGVYDWGGGTLLGDGADPEEPTSLSIDYGFQQVLGLKTLIGRRFTEADCEPGASPVVMLGEQMWRRRYNADSELIGRTVLIDDQAHEVVGVVPDDFRFPEETEAVQLFRTRPMARDIKYYSLGLVAKLKPDVEPEVAEAQLEPVAQRLAETFPETNKDRTFYLHSMREEALGGVESSLLLLWGAVGFVLLLACMNAANLLLSRAATKSHDIAVCSAIGARRHRIMQRMLGESLLLSLIAGALGLLIAQIGIELIAGLGMTDLPRGGEIGIDGRVFGFAFLLSIVAGLLYGAIPAWQVSRVNVAEMMKDGGGRTSIGPAGQRIRAALTVGEVAIACVLLVAAGLMIRSLMQVRATDPGFAWQNTLGLTLWADQPRDADGRWTVNFFDEMIRSVEAVPGVQSASLVSGMPWQFMFDNSLQTVIQGHPDFVDDEPALIKYRLVSEDYLSDMKVPLRLGRHLERSDDGTAELTIVVSEEFATRYWPDENPIGKYVQLGEKRTAVQIVGVVGGVRERRLDEEPVPMIYLPFRSNPSIAMTVMVRTDRDPGLLERSVQKAVWNVSPTQGIWRTRTLAELLEVTLARDTLYMRLLVIFAVVAVALAAAGIYGVISFSVAQRTHEIGIRMALGASNTEILRRVLGRGLRLSAIGLALGLPAAFAVARVMDSLFYEVGPLDPATYVSVTLLVLGVATAACYVPAWRATRVQPALSLRVE